MAPLAARAAAADLPCQEPISEGKAEAKIPLAFRWRGWDRRHHDLFLPSSDDESEGASCGRDERREIPTRSEGNDPEGPTGAPISDTDAR